MSRLCTSCAAALALLWPCSFALADGFNQPNHLSAEAQSKVNKALASGWAAGSKSVTAQGRTVVHFGSRKKGNCTVNVGTTQAAKPGQRAPREVVVTAREIINVCR